MYKILIKSKNNTYNKQSHLRRLIFEQQLTTINHQQQHRKSSKLFINQMIGDVHLYKQINIKGDQKIIQQQGTLKFQLKSQIILLLDVQKNQLDKILHQAAQRQQHMDFIEEIYGQSIENKLQKLIVIMYFKNIIVCQEIYNLIIQNYNALPLYLKEVVIVSDQNNNINTVKLTKIANRDQKVPTTGEEQKRWIQLPDCLKCLQRLQSDVTGIPSQIFVKKSSKNKPLCLTCKVIERKRVQHQQTHCQDCQSSKDNWICLVCSKIGCGRYVNADAYKHFKEENHILTMDLSTQRVWNYLSDCFSHRVVPLQKHQFTLKFPQFSQKNNDKQNEQSLQAAFWQYCSVVSEELQRQRIFYEKQMSEEDEKYLKQKQKIHTKIEQLQKQIAQKQISNKKSNKKAKKAKKRLQQIKQKCSLDRQILNNYEKIIKQQNRQEINMQFIQSNSFKIKQKMKILEDLEQEISNVIVKLTE